MGGVAPEAGGIFVEEGGYGRFMGVSFLDKVVASLRAVSARPSPPALLWDVVVYCPTELWVL